MKSGELAKRLRVTDATIRDWADQYSDLLSPQARNKRPRVFDPDDVMVMATIRWHREMDVPTPHEEIRERLEKGERVDALPDLPDAALEEARSITAYKPADTFDELKAHFAQLLQERNEAIERERAALAELTAIQREIGRLEGIVQQAAHTQEQLDHANAWLLQAQAAIQHLQRRVGQLETDKAWLDAKVEELNRQLNEKSQKRGCFGG